MNDITVTNVIFNFSRLLHCASILKTTQDRPIVLFFLRLVCVSWTITGHPRNSVFIRRV